MPCGLSIDIIDLEVLVANNILIFPVRVLRNTSREMKYRGQFFSRQNARLTFKIFERILEKRAKLVRFKHFDFHVISALSFIISPRQIRISIPSQSKSV